jgi:hypothetical protein
LAGGFVEAGLKVRPSMFPSHFDGGFHIVSQDDELGRSAVNSEKLRGEQGVG